LSSLRTGVARTRRLGMFSRLGMLTSDCMSRVIGK
jgi:hypothetical protein